MRVITLEDDKVAHAIEAFVKEARVPVGTGEVCRAFPESDEDYILRRLKKLVEAGRIKGRMLPGKRRGLWVFWYV